MVAKRQAMGNRVCLMVLALSVVVLVVGLTVLENREEMGVAGQVVPLFRVVIDSLLVNHLITLPFKEMQGAQVRGLLVAAGGGLLVMVLAAVAVFQVQAVELLMVAGREALVLFSLLAVLILGGLQVGAVAAVRIVVAQTVMKATLNLVMVERRDLNILLLGTTALKAL
jgi:hypothetical protein